jgi:RNA polymerase sigma-70 factor (ECF subfamily)
MADSAAGLHFGASDKTWGDQTWGDSSAQAGNPAEHALATALRRGEDAAYEVLLRRFEDPIYNLVYRLSHNASDADDLTQEVFLKVFRCIGSFRGDSSLKTWIYRIAVNEARNHLRSFGRKRGNEVALEKESEDGIAWDEVLEDHQASPYDSACSAEFHEIVETCLREVKPVFREAVVLRDVEDMGYEEIAEILGVNIGTVKSRIVRGRQALKDLMAARLYAPQCVTAGEIAVRGAK